MSGALPPVAALVPHQGPMLLLDEVIDSAPGRIRCRAVFRDDSLFARAGRVEAVVGLELMAQAVAAFAGLKAHRAGEPPRIGFLLGTRELALGVEQFVVGEELVVEAEHVFGDQQLGCFACTVAAGDQVIARAQLSVYQASGEESLP